ncbi:MAG: hypothetical protein HFE51_04165 [Clostridia bacterium]|nr:hypothetical protein [Clostridia bacterium]MCI9085602.1 hypothetical protein [Clostridia bacterium]
MKKRVISVLLTLCMAFSYTVFATAEGGDKVEIKFKVGDSVLSINGADVEVETPYIAGDGTTLVPLRVITEAFGAQVDWEGTTKTITLTYPEVGIVLQIGSVVAQVNEHNETLLEAPALSANGVTMVPLRFISETFGADVGYDNATSSITVTKGDVEGTQTVTGITNMTRTGDSYYKWSIDTPVDMDMTDRGLDGMNTEFTADDGSELHIDIFKYTDDNITPFDEKFSNVKDSFGKYTLMEAEKLTDKSGNKYMHFQAKDSKDILDLRIYYSNDNIVYEVVSLINISNDTTTKDMILSIADSFNLGNIDKDTYDLSNVTDGMREIKSDKYKLSMRIPADYTQYSSKAENEFIFINTDSDVNSNVHLGIFSKTDTVTAEKLAKYDHDNRIKMYNPDLSKISDVEKINDSEYRYTHTISGSSKGDNYNIDVFFEKGDYIYNMSVVVPSKNDASTAEKIIGSLKTEELDSAQIGKLLRNDSDNETLASNTIEKYKFSLPVSWKGIAGGMISSAHSTAYIHNDTGSAISIVIDKNDDFNGTSLTKQAESFYKYVKEQSDNKMIDKIEYETIGANRFARFTYKVTKDGYSDSYITVYMLIKSKELIMFSLYDEDIYYKGENIEILKNALETFTEK